MLTYRIDSSAENAKIIREIMLNIEGEETEDAELSLIEKGFPVSEKGLSLVFSKDNLAELIRFLYKLYGVK